VEDADLHGAPLTVVYTRRCDDLARAATRLGSIAAHDALVLLKASFSAPKLMYTLRAASCSEHSALQGFDDLLGLANVPAVKEPIGLLRSDGKRPDGPTQIHGRMENV